MIAFDEALRRVGQAARPLGPERIPLARAAGRILAAPIVAQVDSPPADCSAMDGYAVSGRDLAGSLRVVGEAFAGRGFAGTVEPGTCVRIFTGAPIPRGADRVVIQEVVERVADRIVVPGPPADPPHVRKRASDFAAGETLVEPGRSLDPRALVAAAAADLAEVEVWRRPGVIVLATGDELAPPGEARGRAGAIPESVSFGVAALAERHGARTLGSLRLADAPAELERAAGEALDRADLIVVTGGASVGEKDFARAMFAPHGLELVFAKVAMKPGKPVWLVRARDRLVMGLPGNPSSALVTARLLLAPLVSGLAGGPTALDWRTLSLTGPLAGCGDRETFFRAARAGAGARPLPNQDSGAQKTLAAADLLLRRRPHDPPLETGETVEALDF